MSEILQSLRPWHFLAWTPIALLVACASSNDNSSETGHRSLSQRLNEQVQFKQNADGQWAPDSDRRSSFESQGSSPYFKGNVEKKEYQSTAFQKKPFWGRSDYTGKSDYQVSEDGDRFRQTSLFAQGNAKESQQAARTTGTYATSNVSKGAAREGSARRLDRPSDAETDVRRRVFAQPQVLNSRSGRSMSVEQSNSILGR